MSHLFPAWIFLPLPSIPKGLVPGDHIIYLILRSPYNLLLYHVKFWISLLGWQFYENKAVSLLYFTSIFFMSGVITSINIKINYIHSYADVCTSSLVSLRKGMIHLCPFDCLGHHYIFRWTLLSGHFSHTTYPIVHQGNNCC